MGFGGVCFFSFNLQNITKMSSCLKTNEYFIGYLPKYKNGLRRIKNDKPYWAGLCDIPNGCNLSTARELVDAKIYHGNSLCELWDEIVICSIAGLSVEEWIANFNK